MTPIKMVTRGRSKKPASNKDTSKEPKQKEESMNRVKTRDLQDNHQVKKSKGKEEGDDETDELPSRQG